MNDTDESENVNKRLYLEVRYAKNASLRLKHSDPIFRLRHDNKNLCSNESAENLIKYIGTSRNSGSLTMDNLAAAIKKITGIFLEKTEKSNIEPGRNQIKPGEHVAVFWVEKVNKVVLVSRYCKKHF